MLILGIDPGPSMQAIVTWDGQRAVFREMDLDAVPGFLATGVDFGPVAIEDFVVYRALDVHGRETIKAIGALRYMCSVEGVETVEIPRADVLRHFRVTKGGDAALRPAVFDRFGGRDTAVGGVKCPKCKGKGWTGREHKPCPRWKQPPGPLYGLKGSHLLAALAVALVAWDRQANDKESMRCED
jgi:hypothetical protein